MDPMLLGLKVEVLLECADHILFDQQLLAAVGAKAFDSTADSMRDAMKNITALAGQQVGLHITGVLQTSQLMHGAVCCRMSIRCI